MSIHLKRSPEQVLSSVTGWFQSNGAKMLCGADCADMPSNDWMAEEGDDALYVCDEDMEAEECVDGEAAEQCLPVGGEAHVLEALQHRVNQKNELLQMFKDMDSEAASDASGHELPVLCEASSVQKHGAAVNQSALTAARDGRACCETGPDAVSAMVPAEGPEISNLTDILAFLRPSNMNASPEKALLSRLRDLRQPILRFCEKVKLAEKVLGRASVLGERAQASQDMNAWNYQRHCLKKAAEFAALVLGVGNPASLTGQVFSERRQAATCRRMRWSLAQNPQLVAFVLGPTDTQIKLGEAMDERANGLGGHIHADAVINSCSSFCLCSCFM